MERQSVVSIEFASVCHCSASSVFSNHETPHCSQSSGTRSESFTGSKLPVAPIMTRLTERYSCSLRIVAPTAASFSSIRWYPRSM